MRVKKVSDPGVCEVVIAEFVFGVQGCGEPTNFVETDSGEGHRVCLEHIRASRAVAA